MSTTIQFLGAARTVTGSKHVVSHRGKTVMLDCGMFQGVKEWRMKNWDPFPLPMGYVDDVILSHAHMDHSGFLPRLVRLGFTGRVFATPATAELCGIMLPDSAHIQEEDARYANKEGFSRHSPALPLYTVQDAETALGLLRPVDYETVQDVDRNISFEFLEAGHILGSALVMVKLRKEDGSVLRLLFTGDLGRYGEHMLPDPAAVPSTDFLVVESTYGNRLHHDDDPEKLLAEIINTTYRRGGVVIVPSFAVGRTQEILIHLHALQDTGRIPPIPVFLDSPLAANATRIFCRYVEDQKFPATIQIEGGECPVLCQNLKISSTVRDSMAINDLTEPAVVISASGMCEAGRVLHHLKMHMPNPRNAVVFVGYQAEGTRGRRILDGEKEVKIHGQKVPVRASIHSIDSFSAHADHDEIFCWLSNFSNPPKKTFVVHGELSAMDSLAKEVRTRLGWAVETPAYLEKAVLE